LSYNSIMKKLLLLLILSFFSAQGFAAGCPDGSESAKFIFQCESDYLTAVKLRDYLNKNQLNYGSFDTLFNLLN